MRNQKKVKYNNPKIIGITGGIGTGQTTASKMFKALGCKVINVDQKAKEAIRRDATLRREIRSIFGETVFYRDGRLNRKKLGSMVFNDPVRLQQLNRIVHPRMVSTVIEEMETARFSGKYPLVIIDAALIYELSIEQMFDAIIVISADMPERIERLKIRDGFEEKDVIARVNRQIPLDDKKEWADHVVDNNGTEKELESKVRGLFKLLSRGTSSPQRSRSRKKVSN